MFPRTILLCSLAVLGSIEVDANTGQFPRFTQLSVQDGLSQSSVQQILEDRKGLMWFGTQEGLNRFDGYRFTVHRAREEDGFLHDHDITALVDDAKGDLWVGTSRGLYRHVLDTGRFDACGPPVAALDIQTLARDTDGLIFVAAGAADQARLWVVDPAGAQCRPRALDGDAFAPLSQVTALAAGRDSTMWAAANGKLLKVAGVGAASGGRVTEARTDVGAISVIALDPTGDLWLGSPDGDLLRYRTADGRIDRFPLVPRQTLSMLAGKGGEIWIGARRGGLTRLDPATGAIVTYRRDPEDPASLLSDDVAAIHEDASGNLWIGTWNGGVSRFDPHAQGFTTLRHRPRVEGSLPGDDAVVMTETADGRLWLITRSGMVATGDPRPASFRTTATLSDRGRITAIVPWDVNLLVATARGLSALDASGREVPIPAALQPLARRSISAIRNLPGALWIGSGTDVYRVTGAASREALRVDRYSLPFKATISAITPSGGDGLWIGSEAGEVAGLAWSDPAGAVTQRPLALADPQARDSLASHGFVTTLLQHGNALWLATRRGLGRIDLASGTVSWKDGLPSSNVAGIAPGSDGQLWIAHNRGLTRLNPANNAMTHFGEALGAQGRGYADGAWAAGGSGLLYFGGQGITVFDPREVGISDVKPRVVFTALEILRRPVVPRWRDPGSPLERTIDAQDQIALPPAATVFSVEMAPIHYGDPSANRLRYRLDGFDSEWIETDARNRIATYTNLAPGHYTLRAQAATRNGDWSGGEATIAITLLPPWWRTTGALVLWSALGVMAAGLLWKAVRRRERIKLALIERETLRRESLTDSMTGLHNRRFLISWLDQEVPRLLREYRADGIECGADLLLLLIDVDHFKSINDRHSHAVGDRVLSRVAAALKDAIRGSDLAVRWGGDEFLVVIRSLQRNRAAEYAERLREAVEAMQSGQRSDADPGATISIGYAAFPFLPHDAEALTWQQTLDLADHALALSKRRGRNSSTGLRAAAAASVADVHVWLAGRNGDTPAVLEIETAPWSGKPSG